MSLDPSNRFIVGINNAWFGNQYDHDLGHNQFSILRLYRNTIPNPSVADPTPDMPYISSNPTELSNFFQNIQTQQKNLKLVRVWLFERFEGLVYDNSNNIVGIDNTFQQNVITLLNVANHNGIKIYFCLFDPWGIYGSTPQDLVTKNKTADYLALQATWKSLANKLMKDNITLSSFFNYALKPLLQSIGTHPALFAIDLVNEPEGFTSNDTSISLSDIQKYITLCANFIHGCDPYLKVSCGFQCFQTIFDNLSGLSQSLDFFDFHEYNETGIPQISWQQINFANKPCLIGECGYRNITTPGDPTKELATIRGFMTNYRNGGFAGCLPWIVYGDNFSAIDNAVQTYADALPMVNLQPSQQQPTQPQQPQQPAKRCFIATAAMGSELHPHVQFLRDYRDYVLLQSQHRRQFERILEIYYRFSPFIAEAMDKDRRLKFVIKYVVVCPTVLSLKILVRLFGSY